MNTKIWIQLAKIIVVMALGTSMLPAASHSKKDKGKDKDKDSEYIEGDLTVQGDVHLESSLDLGTTGTSTSAMLFQYSEVSTDYTFSLAATQPATVFLWQDNAVGTLKNKMKLDGNNVLSLFDGNGTAGIVLSPNTGLIILAGSGSGIQLSDGTVLASAASLRSTALYTPSGNVAASVGTNGQVQFPNGITLPGGTLGTAAFTDSTAYATSPQGALAASALQRESDPEFSAWLAATPPLYPTGDGSRLSFSGISSDISFSSGGTISAGEPANWGDDLSTANLNENGEGLWFCEGRGGVSVLLGREGVGLGCDNGRGGRGVLFLDGATRGSFHAGFGFDGDQGVIYGGAPNTSSWDKTASIGPDTRKLYTDNTTYSLDWANRQLVGAWQVNGSLMFSDGTVLSNAASLRSTALYDTGGNARMTFDGNGNLVVSAPMVMQGAAIDFGSGNTLNPSNVAYLKQTLANLGYRAPGAPRDPSFGAVTLGGGASTGEYSFSAGIGTKASGYASTALGESTNATGRASTAFGQSTQATGSFSTATGEKTKANSYASLALGRNNVGSFASGGDAAWMATDPVLEIGNGEADGGIPSNAVTVFKNGKLRTSNVMESKVGFRTPPQGDLSMGDFTAGSNPADLVPTSGLKYQGE
jgi:hypothetical protein